MKDREATLQILEMLEQGKITPEEAEALLQALESRTQPQPRPSGSRTSTLRDLFSALWNRRQKAPPEARHPVSHALEGVQRLEILLEGGGLELQADPERTLLEGETEAEDTWEVVDGVARWRIPAMPWASATRARIPEGLPLQVEGQGCALRVRQHRARLGLDLQGGKAVVEDHEGPLQAEVQGGVIRVTDQVGTVDLWIQGGKAELHLREMRPLRLVVEGGAAIVRVPPGAEFRVKPEIQGGVLQMDDALRARMHREGDAYVLGAHPEAEVQVNVQGGRVEFVEQRRSAPAEPATRS